MSEELRTNGSAQPVPPNTGPNDFPATLTSSHEQQPGTVLRTPSAFLPSLPGYEILSELGRAGMGVVYKAWQLNEERLVAIKMLRDGILAGAEQFERFCNEAQILARLEHPHIIRIHEVGELDGRLYMVLRFAEGGSLADHLSTRGWFAPQEAAHLIEVLARAMHHVHLQGILHRDLKPANILLDAQGNPMIADFGLGKRSAFQDCTISGAILGTPSYMSPEQADGKKDLRPATDVYSLGAILYELLTAQPPFRGDNVLNTLEQVRTQSVRPLRSLRPEISADLEAICLKCLQKDPRERYATAEDLAEELQLAQLGLPLRLTGKPTETAEERRGRVSSSVAQGIRCMDRGERRLALLWFTEALRLEREVGASPQETLHRVRIASLLRESPRLVHLWYPPSPITRAEISPDGQKVVTGHEDGRIRLLFLQTGEVRTSAEGHEGNVNRVCFSPEGARVVSASDDGTARVWDVATAHAVSPPLRHRQWVTHASFNHDGTTLVTASADGTAWLWDPQTGRPHLPPVDHGGMLWSVTLHPAGTALVTTGWDGCARVWNTSTREMICPPLRHQGWVRHAAFQQRGGAMVTASDDQTARIWQVSTGEPLTLPLKHDMAVRRVAFTQDDRHLITWAADGTVRVWEVATGALRTSRIPGPLLSGDGEYGSGGRIQLECGVDGALRVWDRAPCLPGSNVIRERALTNAEMTVVSQGVAMSPDGKLRATVTREGTLRVWDITSCEEVTPPLALPEKDCVVAFTPDGRLRATSPRGEMLKEWDLAPDPRPVGDLIRLAQVLSGRRLDSQGNPQPLEPRLMVANWDEWQRQCPESVQIEPEEIQRWHERASQFCESAGLWGEAVAQLDVLLQLHPTDAVLWGRRARLWCRAGRWEQALEDYSQAIHHQEGEWVYWYCRGLVHSHLGHWKRATHDLARAALLNRRPWRIWYRLGIARAQLRQYKGALNDFARVLRRHPESRGALAMRAFLAARMRQWKRAQLDYAGADSLGDDRPWLRHQHALVCLQLRDGASYQTLCQKLLGRALKTGEVYQGAWAAWTCVLGENPGVDWTKVLQLAERTHGVCSTPGNPLQQFAQTLLGAALYRAQRTHEAIELLERHAWKSRQDSPWDWLILSLAHQRAGNLRASRHWLRRTHRWLGRPSPSHPEPLPPPPPLSWPQQLELKLLRRQAESFFRTRPGGSIRLSRRTARGSQAPE